MGKCKPGSQGTVLVDWLVDSGGPAVRYRTARELIGGVPDPAVTQDLLESPQVRLWLDRLKHVKAAHNSSNDCLENVMGKLLELGLHAGLPALDERIGFVRKWMAGIAGRPGGMMRALDGAIVAWCFARAGYDDEAVRSFLSRRLDTVCRAIREHGYDIYADARAFGDIPKAFAGRPLVKPDLTPGGEMLLPYIHDLYALSSLPAAMDTPSTREKVRAIVRYILDDAYQTLYEGYGILRADKRRYYAVGWSIHLPGFRGLDFTRCQTGLLVQRLELMAHFPTARRHPWVRAARKHLEGFRTQRGAFLFPRSYLNEQRAGYWVAGAHMGLEENRRAAQAIEVESTFRMLRIQKLLEQ